MRDDFNVLLRFAEKPKLNMIVRDRGIVPTKLTDLNNDGNFVRDPNYVHTDNNFTAERITEIEANTRNTANNLAEIQRTNNALDDLRIACNQDDLVIKETLRTIEASLLQSDDSIRATIQNLESDMADSDEEIREALGALRQTLEAADNTIIGNYTAAVKEVSDRLSNHIRVFNEYLGNDDAGEQTQLEQIAELRNRLSEVKTLLDSKIQTNDSEHQEYDEFISTTNNRLNANDTFVNSANSRLDELDAANDSMTGQIQSLQNESHIHSNMDILGQITEVHTHANLDVLNRLTEEWMSSDRFDLTLLEPYNAAIESLREQVEQLAAIGGGGGSVESHTHSNKTILDNTTASFTIELKNSLTTLVSLLENGESNATVDTLREVLKAFEDYPESTNLFNLLSSKSDTTHTHTYTLDDIQDGTARSLNDYVKTTDYASTSKPGVVKINPNNGINIGSESKTLIINAASESQISSKVNSYNPIVPRTLDYAVKSGITTNSLELTEGEKSSAKEWLGVATKTSELENDSNFITKDVNNLANYELKTNTGSSIVFSIDPTTYIMTLSLKNSAGTILSTGIIDLPLETMVIGAGYRNGILTLTLKNGQVLDVDISSIISGLVSDTIKVAGFDLKDDITDSELKTALGITDIETNISGLQSGKADKSEIPTKTSQLNNDSGFTTTTYVDTAISTAITTTLGGSY